MHSDDRGNNFTSEFQLQLFPIYIVILNCPVSGGDFSSIVAAEK